MAGVVGKAAMKRTLHDKMYESQIFVVIFHVLSMVVVLRQKQRIILMKKRQVGFQKVCPSGATMAGPINPTSILCLLFLRR